MTDDKAKPPTQLECYPTCLNCIAYQQAIKRAEMAEQRLDNLKGFGVTDSAILRGERDLLQSELTKVNAELDEALGLYGSEFKKYRDRGFELAQERALSAKYREALVEIRDEDYRGNRPRSAEIAYKALEDK